MTNFALEILNLNKKEVIKMDTISNQDFTEVNAFSCCLVSCLAPTASISSKSVLTCCLVCIIEYLVFNLRIFICFLVGVQL